MKNLPLVLCALGFAGLAQARPHVLEETRTIARPDSSWTYFGRIVAVDTSWALVQGDRFVPDPNAEGGTRHDGAAHLYEKVGSNWVYRGVLGAIEAIDEWTKPGFAMKNGVAMVIQKTPRIFERNGSTWTEAVANMPEVQGPDIEILNGKILVPTISCSWNAVVLSKTNGVWSQEGLLPGNFHECGDNPSTPRVDLENTFGRAVVLNALDTESVEPVAKLFRPVAQAGPPVWEQFAELARPTGATIFGPDVAMRGSYVAVTGPRETGTWMFRELNGVWGRFIEPMEPADAALQPLAISATSLQHTSQYFLQRNFSFDRNAYVVNVFTTTFVEPTSRTPVTHRASLVARGGGSLGSSVDISGNRVIVGGLDNFTGNNTVRVFDMPAPLPTPAFRQDDFENFNGNFGFDWEVVPGSEFARVPGSNTFWRQSSTAGDAGAFVPSSESTNQAIEADITPRAFSGSDRWVGLVVRRRDAANYYYLTARSSGSLQIRKIVNGVYSTLASTPFPVTIGQPMHLRLEAIGTALRVYVDGRQRLTVYDSSHTRGTVGVAMYRTGADFDGIFVSQAPHTSIYRTDFSTPATPQFMNDLGTWQQSGGIYRQTSLTTADATAFIGGLGDQAIVQVRLRINAFVVPSFGYVGVLFHYTDNLNYHFFRLNRSGELSVGAVSGGFPYIVAQKNYPVTPGTWYTVRAERVGNVTRVHVNGQLQLTTFGGFRKGRFGLVTNHATADFDDFLAYEP